MNLFFIDIDSGAFCRDYQIMPNKYDLLQTDNSQ